MFISFMRLSFSASPEPTGVLSSGSHFRSESQACSGSLCHPWHAALLCTTSNQLQVLGFWAPNTKVATMASSKATAAALRLQNAVQEYLGTSEAGAAFPSTVPHAQALLKSLADNGISDRAQPRGRPLKRVTDQKFTYYRKRCNYLTKRNAALRKKLTAATNPKRQGRITTLWFLGSN